jgi:hypothetical protein
MDKNSKGWTNNSSPISSRTNAALLPVFLGRFYLCSMKKDPIFSHSAQDSTDSVESCHPGSPPLILKVFMVQMAPPSIAEVFLTISWGKLSRFAQLFRHSGLDAQSLCSPCPLHPQMFQWKHLEPHNCCPFHHEVVSQVVRQVALGLDLINEMIVLYGSEVELSSEIVTSGKLACELPESASSMPSQGITCPSHHPTFIWERPKRPPVVTSVTCSHLRDRPMHRNLQSCCCPTEWLCHWRRSHLLRRGTMTKQEYDALCNLPLPLCNSAKCPTGRIKPLDS